MGSSNDVSHISVYHVSIPSLSSLQLTCPDLVLVSPFVALGLLFMIMFMGMSLLVIQSCLPSDTICLGQFLCSAGWE